MSLDIIGLLQSESTGVNLQSLSTCYGGIRMYPQCKRRVGRYLYDALDAYNEIDGSSNAFCLQCCNHIYKGAGERIDEVWDLECDVTDPSLALDYYGYEFQFARNRDEQDEGVVRCAMGRMGCEYAWDGNTEYDNRDLTCTSLENDGDFGSCDDEDECSCKIPGSQRGGTPPSNGNGDYNTADGIVQRSLDAADACTRTRSQSLENGTVYYLKGYTLTIDVEERSNTKGEYWRMVRSCKVETHEVTSLQEGDTFYERIRMRGPRKRIAYRWFSPEEGLLFIIFGTLGMCLCSLLIVRCVRNTPCPTCGAKLIWSKHQCVMCRFYEVPMPDPVLLARVRARRTLGGPGLAVHAAKPVLDAPPSSFTGRCVLYVRRSRVGLRILIIAAAKGLFAFLVWLLRSLANVLCGLLRCCCDADDEDQEAPPPPSEEPPGEATAIPLFVAKPAPPTRQPDVKPTKPTVSRFVYLADPVLRRENIFGKLTRRISPHEHKVVVIDQLHGQSPWHTHPPESSDEETKDGPPPSCDGGDDE